MTHALGSNTCNVPVNLLREERDILGKLAFRSDCSLGEYLRRMTRRGVALSDPESAKRLARVRRDRLRCSVMLGIFAAHFALFGAESIRRPSRSVRIPRVERRTEA